MSTLRRWRDAFVLWLDDVWLRGCREPERKEDQ
jgi:hypothetical protein